MPDNQEGDRPGNCVANCVVQSPPVFWYTAKLTTPERPGVSNITVLPVNAGRKPALAWDGDSIKAELATTARTATFLSLAIASSFPAWVPTRRDEGFPARGSPISGMKGIVRTYRGRERLSGRAP